LVAAGAAMFVMLSTLAVRPDDSFRIAGKVVSGIGFLGAGVILRNGLNITGLNTAATLSCSAAIGTLAGYGMYGSAITGAVAVVAANVCLRPIGKALNRGMGTVDAGRQNSLLEQIVSRLSLEPGVSGVSWEIVAEHD
jgi:putative Mg2+ transporter-C (MgtC) family protein